MKKDAIRQIRLLEMLSEKKRLDIRTVVEALSISEATARRLFTDLEKSGKLIRTHGGIQAAPEIAPDYSFRLSSVQHTLKKTRSARRQPCTLILATGFIWTPARLY